MSGVRTKRIVWTVIFLSITLAAIVMEVVAGVWHPMGTIPWTEYIAAYVPWPIQLIAYVALAVWLPFHFYRHDRIAKRAFEQGASFGAAQQQRVAARAYDNGRTAGWHEGVAGKPMPPTGAMVAELHFRGAVPVEGRCPVCGHDQKCPVCGPSDARG